MKARIKQNAWDNWYGYLGRKRVEMFFNTSTATAEQNAQAWLKEQQMGKYIIYKIKKSPYGDKKMYFTNEKEIVWCSVESHAAKFDTEMEATMALGLAGFRMGSATRCEREVAVESQV